MSGSRRNSAPAAQTFIPGDILDNISFSERPESPVAESEPATSFRETIRMAAILGDKATLCKMLADPDILEIVAEDNNTALGLLVLQAVAYQKAIDEADIYTMRALPARDNCCSAIELLLSLSYGANPNVPVFYEDNCGESRNTWLLHYVVESAAINILKLLAKVASRIQLTAVDCEGRSALFLAVESKNIPLIQTLLAMGADPDQRLFYQGRTCTVMARMAESSTPVAKNILKRLQAAKHPLHTASPEAGAGSALPVAVPAIPLGVYPLSAGVLAPAALKAAPTSKAAGVSAPTIADQGRDYEVNSCCS